MIGVFICHVPDLFFGYFPEERVHKAGTGKMPIFFNQADPFCFFGRNITVSFYPELGKRRRIPG